MRSGESMLRSAAASATIAVALVTTLGSCTVAPSISNEVTYVPVDEVVQSLKCELLHAIIKPMKLPPNPKTEPDDFGWFKTWTAKIDLTLAVSDLAQVNPTGTLTTPLRNAYPPNVGPSVLNGPSIAAVTQKFSFGLGGGVSDQRTRTEDVSFTWTLMDLEVEAQQNPSLRHCVIEQAYNGSSALGLSEWIEDRIVKLVVRRKDGFPVLKEGYQKQTAVGGAVAKVTPPVASPHAPFNQPLIPPVSEMGKLIATWTEEIAKNIIYVNAAVEAAQKAKSSCVGALMEDLKNVAELNSTFATQAAKVREIINGDPELPKIEFYWGDLAAGKNEQKAKGNLDAKLSNAPTVDAALNRTIELQKAYEAAHKAAQDVYDYTKSAKKQLESCKSPKDPPIDISTYNAQFVLAANIGVAPSWSLLRVSGPSPTTGSLGSYARGDTNTISIILAPRASGSNVEGERLINAIKGLAPTAITPGAF